MKLVDHVRKNEQHDATMNQILYMKKESDQDRAMLNIHLKWDHCQLVAVNQSYMTARAYIRGGSIALLHKDIARYKKMSMLLTILLRTSYSRLDLLHIADNACYT